MKTMKGSCSLMNVQKPWKYHHWWCSTMKQFIFYIIKSNPNCHIRNKMPFQNYWHWKQQKLVPWPFDSYVINIFLKFFSYSFSAKFSYLDQTEFSSYWPSRQMWNKLPNCHNTTHLLHWTMESLCWTCQNKRGYS